MKSGTFLRTLCVCGFTLAAASASAAVIVDGDADGVADDRDHCLYTPVGISAGTNGCSRPGDEDEDDIPDLIDACPLSPAGAIVDEQGCAVDGDLDGIADGVDHCPTTRADSGVDDAGCAAGEKRQALAVRTPRAIAPPVAIESPSSARVAARIPTSIYTPVPPPVALPPPVPDAPAASARIARVEPIEAVVPPTPVSPAPVAVPETSMVEPLPAPEPARASVPTAGPPETIVATREVIAPSSVPVPPRGIQANPPLPGQRYLTLYFNPGSTDLTGDSRTILQRQPANLNAELQRRPQANLILVGHAETRSDGDRAALAAARRAESVHQQLIQWGVPAERMTVRSDGVNQPRFGGAELGRNRRVELYLYDPVAHGYQAEVPSAVSVTAGLGADASAAVAFPPYSTQLDPTATRTLDSFLETMVAALRPDGSVRVRVSGSADAGETAMPTKALAQGRARAVRSYLVSIGLKEQLVEIDPVAGTSRQDANGRRAEVRLVGMGGG